MTRHPLADVEIYTYQCRQQAPKGHKFLAFLGRGTFRTVYFRGDTEEGAYQAALDFKVEQIKKHEVTYRKRAEAAEKARAARERKREAT
jgi:hypothetical protein